MKITYRIIVACLIACMPIAAITLTENAVLRMSDLYKSQFKSAETAANTGLGIKDDQLADFFSDFMRGKIEEFDLRLTIESLAEEEENHFRAGEQTAMVRARGLLNKNLYGGAAALAVALVCFFLAWRKGYHEALRWAVKVSFVPWAAMWGIFLIILLLPGGGESVLRYLYGYTIGEGSLLHQILTVEVYRTFVIAVLAGSLALMMIMSWAIYKVTKPKMMFGQSETVRRR